MVIELPMLPDTEFPFELIAIYSGLEDYRMAFFLNKFLHTKFQRAEQDLDLTDEEGHKSNFSLYSFVDQSQHLEWYLIANQYTETNTSSVHKNHSLFSKYSSNSTTYFLIPERRQANYWLQVMGEPDLKQVQELESKIKAIHGVKAAFHLGSDTLRSKQNLIF